MGNGERTLGEREGFGASGRDLAKRPSVVMAAQSAAEEMFRIDVARLVGVEKTQMKIIVCVLIVH